MRFDLIRARTVTNRKKVAVSERSFNMSEVLSSAEKLPELTEGAFALFLY